MSLGLPEAKREKVEALIREVTEHAHETLRDEGDERFYEKSREFAAGIARGVLALGYRRDSEELNRLVDELFEG